MTKQIKDDVVAGIQYPQDCIHAVQRLLQYGDRLDRVRILTCGSRHCLLLNTNSGDLMAVKSGFASGYGGEGSDGFAYVLRLLEAYCDEIDEFDIELEVFKRVDASALYVRDLERLSASQPIRPSRWHDYMFDRRSYLERKDLWAAFPPVIPLKLVDPRIAHLALRFWENPDAQLMAGWRRLEEAIRERTGIEEHGKQLLSSAFLRGDAKLAWTHIPEQEAKDRALLFTSLFGAYRNARAHRERQQDDSKHVEEFVLLNHLFRLEREAVDRFSEATEQRTE